MKLGIIGKPQSGKTTVFNASAGRQEAVGDFSNAEHRALIKVPDSRVDQLTEIVKPKKITYAEIDFLDAAPFSGKGKESTGLEISQDLRLTDAFLMVINSFEPDADPSADIADLTAEMILTDQVMVESNLEKRAKKIKMTGDKSGQIEMDILRRCLAQLEEEKPLIDLEMSPDEEKLVRGFKFLSQKPLLIVINISEDDIAKAEEISARFADLVAPGKREVAVMCGKIEMELVGLDNDEKRAFLDDLGISTPATENVIQKSYSLLGLISYLTAGEPEVRAWTIKRGTNAQKAAGVIHSDIERGFIRAEVTAFNDYIEHKTPAALKAAGKTRLEGKEYIVNDGDVVLFRFNV